MSALETLAEAAWRVDWEIAGGPQPMPSWATYKENDPETAAIYQCQGASYLDALDAAGYAVVPVEMTDEQARRSLDGNRLADRLRAVDPEHFALLVASRRATWRQMVAEMKENADEGSMGRTRGKSYGRS
jgi:hypothetical protein